MLVLLLGWSYGFSQSSKENEEALVKASLESPEISEKIKEVFQNEVVLLEGAFPFSAGFGLEVNEMPVVFQTKQDIKANQSAALIFWRLQVIEDKAYVNFILQEGEDSNFALILSKNGGVWQVIDVVVEGGAK